MMSVEDAIIAALRGRGPAGSAELQRLTGKSQPTLSRALRALGGRVAVMGQGKSTRYGLPQPIRGQAAQQALWWTDTNGVPRRWGVLTFLADDLLHVGAEGIDVITRGQLPWFLAPLKLQLPGPRMGAAPRPGTRP